VKPLLQAELLKLRTTRTFAALVGLALSLSLLSVVLTTLIADDFTERDVRALFTFDFTGLFILLLGVMGMAGEWRHRTITSTVLAAPDRVRLLAAKALSYAAAGVVLSFVVQVAMVAVGSTILSIRDELTLPLADLVDVVWRNLLVAALLGALGVCIGAVLRNQVAAIIAVVVFSFVIEPAVIALVPDVGRYGPLVGAPNGIIDVDPFGGDVEESVLLGTGAAALVVLGGIATFFAAAATRLRRFDLV
jgi:ABC-2 type transport system permease protein